MNFEDFEFEEIDTAKKLHEFVKSKIKDSEKYYIFFDEIQHVKEFEKVLASFRELLTVRFLLLALIPSFFLVSLRHCLQGGLPQRFDFTEEKDTKNYLESVLNGIVEKDIYKSDSKIEKYKFTAISSYILF